MDLNVCIFSHVSFNGLIRHARLLFIRTGGFTDFQRKFGHLCVGDVEQPVKDVVDEGDRVLSLGLTTLRLTEICVDDANPKEGRGTPGSAFPFPVQVVPHLYLGNAENSADLACLNRHGIRYILNVTADIPNTFETDMSFKYLQIPITDNLSQNLTSFFPAAIAFIGERRPLICRDPTRRPIIFIIGRHFHTSH